MKKTILFLSIPLFILIVLSSGTGLYLHGFYSRESNAWALQARCQDAFDLFIAAPILLASLVMSVKGSRIAMEVLGGVFTYASYTYVVYCFAVHLNAMFVVYCLALGLSFYSLLLHFYERARTSRPDVLPKGWVIRTAGIYFIAVSSFFYFVWLSQLIPAMYRGVTPADLLDAGIPVNPVHVLDLSVCLPALIITGISLLRRNPVASVFAGPFLVFCCLMELTIAFLLFSSWQAGDGQTAAGILVFTIVAAGDALLFILFERESARTQRSRTEATA